jgi:uracil phosphoribosyltransferase
MNNVSVIGNPFVVNALTVLRDKNTPIDVFRRYSDQLCSILLSESLQDLPLKKITLQTPIASITAESLDTEDIIIVPILRAGVAMLTSALALLPKAKVGFIGLARDEATAIAKEYYYKLPKITQNSIILIVDPMLATGGSILHLLSSLSKTPAGEIRVISVISAPEGLEKVTAAFPEVKIFTAAIDDHLNDQKYIVPGLGDYGDRYFGTE